MGQRKGFLYYEAGLIKQIFMRALKSRFFCIELLAFEGEKSTAQGALISLVNGYHCIIERLFLESKARPLRCATGLNCNNRHSYYYLAPRKTILLSVFKFSLRNTSQKYLCYDIHRPLMRCQMIAAVLILIFCGLVEYSSNNFKCFIWAYMTFL